MSVAAQAAAGVAVASAGVTGAAAAGVLPDAAQDRVGSVIESVTPFELPDRSSFGQEVSDDAKDGGVSGEEVSEKARQLGDERSGGARSDDNPPAVSGEHADDPLDDVPAAPPEQAEGPPEDVPAEQPDSAPADVGQQPAPRSSPTQVPPTQAAKPDSQPQPDPQVEPDAQAEPDVAGKPTERPTPPTTGERQAEHPKPKK